MARAARGPRGGILGAPRGRAGATRVHRSETNMPNFVAFAKASEIPPGTGKCVTANNVSVALFNVGGTFHAISNTCPHRGGPLGDGDLAGDVVTCPWHGFHLT